MLSHILLPVITLIAANATSPQSILDNARAKQAERWAKVENYTITLSVRDAAGAQTPVYYEKITVDGQPTFRMVSPVEYMRDVSTKAGFPPLTPEQAEEMAKGYDMLGDALAQGGGDMPPMDVRGMTGDMGMFVKAGANYQPDDGRGDAKDAMHDMNEFAKRAKLAGSESVPASSAKPDQTRDAFLLVADDLSDVKLEQPEGEAEYKLEKVSLWVDKEQYVPLRLLMNLEVESDGKKMPMTIEKLDLDYKQVGPLYESHQQVYRLSGMMSGMSEKDRKDMEKAKKDMEKAKKELEKMPPEQQEMVKKMMGSQMDKLEQMMAGDQVTSIADVVSIAINEGPPTPYGLGDLTVGGPAAATYPGALTMAGDDGRAELAVAARLPGQAEAIFGLFGSASFPKSGAVDIAGASGTVELEGGAKVSIEGGTGTITVTTRSDTRIAGTFTAMLSGKDLKADDDKTIHFSVSGKFDSGAPVGPYQAPRGSPFPAGLFVAQ
jgi:hypothetical protein